MKKRRKRPLPPETAKPKRHPGRAVAKALDLPPNIFSDLAHIELSGNNEAIVDGCKGVIEYDENIVRLDTGKMTVRFLGSDLSIRSLTDDNAVIEGTITSVEFQI